MVPALYCIGQTTLPTVEAVSSVNVGPGHEAIPKIRVGQVNRAAALAVGTQQESWRLVEVLVIVYPNSVCILPHSRHLARCYAVAWEADASEGGHRLMIDRAKRGTASEFRGEASGFDRVRVIAPRGLHHIRIQGNPSLFHLQQPRNSRVLSLRLLSAITPYNGGSEPQLSPKQTLIPQTTPICQDVTMSLNASRLQTKTSASTGSRPRTPPIVPMNWASVVSPKAGRSVNHSENSFRSRIERQEEPEKAERRKSHDSHVRQPPSPPSLCR